MNTNYGFGMAFIIMESGHVGTKIPDLHKPTGCSNNDELSLGSVDIHRGELSVSPLASVDKALRPHVPKAHVSIVANSNQSVRVNPFNISHTVAVSVVPLVRKRLLLVRIFPSNHLSIIPCTS